MDAIDLIEIRTHLYHLKRKTIYIYIYSGPQFSIWPLTFPSIDTAMKMQIEVHSPQMR